MVSSGSRGANIVGRALEIQINCAARLLRRDRFGERRLADLARAKQHYAWHRTQAGLNGFLDAAGDFFHAGILTLDVRIPV